MTTPADLATALGYVAPEVTWPGTRGSLPTTTCGATPAGIRS